MSQFIVKRVIKLLLFLILSTQYSANASQCEGTPLRNDDSMSVLAWMRHNGNHNRTIKDVICCMPETFKNNYKIVHTSLSAQQSTFASPRLIFGDLNENRIMFSISGGDPSLMQHNNIEVMVNNTREKKLELFDIEFINGKKRATKNPAVCMACHGNQGEMGPAGVRPIFNPSPWPRMVIRPNKRMTCKADRFFQAVKEKTFEAISNNPRFECLEPPGSFAETFFGIDGELESLNARKVRREMKATKDYSKYKPLIFGMAAGCFIHEESFGSGNFKVIDNPLAWLPENFESRKMTETLNVKASLTRAQDDFEIASILVAESRRTSVRANEEESYFQSLYDDLLAGGVPELASGRGFFECDEFISASGIPDYVSVTNRLQSYPARARLYIYDMILREYENGRLPDNSIISQGIIEEGLIRWAFESRGITAKIWGMKIIPNYDRSLANAIRDMDSYRRYIEQFTTRDDDSKRVFNKEALCDHLQQESLERTSTLLTEDSSEN